MKYIFNHLDTPPRILLWPVKDVMMVIAPAFFFIIMGRFLMGVVIGILMALMNRALKRHFGSMHGFGFWEFPHSDDRNPVTPPSYIREFIR